MATLNSYVTVLRLIYLMFGICNFVNAKYEESFSCAGSDAEIDFEKSEAKEPIFTEWFFTSAKTQTRIAKMLSKTAYDQDYKSRVFIDRNKLHLKNINSSDSGMYTRMVRDDSNGRELYTDEVNLTVLSPPSSLPSLHIEKRENSHVMASCKPPRYKGHPEVEIVLKDSKGQRQNSLTTVGGDNSYQCCIEGETRSLQMVGECHRCFGFTLVSWVIMKIFILIFLLIYARCDKDVCCKRNKGDMLCLQVVFGGVLSLALILAITFSLCNDSKRCKDRERDNDESNFDHTHVQSTGDSRENNESNIDQTHVQSTGVSRENNESNFDQSHVQSTGVSRGNSALNIRVQQAVQSPEEAVNVNSHTDQGESFPLLPKTSIEEEGVPTSLDEKTFVLHHDENMTASSNI
ncbi:hypothetical protein KUTeg_005767 [Tegillarca granosa]|uniref:Uncharacterized protein n=1 Tax=Tegillarca granosa TaxID=220873 RepID=A0ABQ9FJG4_TEGGR|nr:hypothetical protein KUTeg_005767 [Tegillarca granosa]